MVRNSCFVSCILLIVLINSPRNDNKSSTIVLDNAKFSWICRGVFLLIVLLLFSNLISLNYSKILFFLIVRCTR